MAQSTRRPKHITTCAAPTASAAIAAFAAVAAFSAFAVLSSCVTDRAMLPGPEPLRAPPAPASVRAYFRERYPPLASRWDVLGPFPSPLDAMRRDLLIRQGGEAHAAPAAGEIAVSPEISSTWRTVTAALQDAWIPRAFRTRYATYVPLHAGRERLGPETALAVARVTSPGGLHRFHLSAWGAARLWVNAQVCIDTFDSHDFFGGVEGFGVMHPGVNRLTVKIENLAYNAVERAFYTFGSWGFYLAAWPAALTAQGTFIDVPFLADRVAGEPGVRGVLAVRAPSLRPGEPVTVSVAAGAAPIMLRIPAPDTDAPRMVPFEAPAPPEAFDLTLDIRSDCGAHIAMPVPMRPTANTILRRAIRSASDDSLQPYLLYAPQNRRDLPPLLYLHGAAATEEQLVGVHTGLILLADALGCPVIAPRAREGALCSAQAESDIHESLRDAEHALGRSWSQVIAVGTGRGAVLALQLAARAPHRISGCVLLPSDAFERNAAIAEPPRMADPMLANLRDLPVLILAGRGDPQADALELQLAAVEARVTRLETISETDPFAGGACRAALRQMLRRAPPHAFTFTTTRAAWRDAWWIRIGRMAGSGPARVEGRIANDGNIAIETEGLHSLEVIPSRLPLSPDTPVSITWNGDTVFSGPLSGTLSVALGPAAPSARREPLRADALLDEIMRAPHAAVVPDDPDWHGAAARVLARAHARARYGRDAGMWSDPILTPDQVEPRSPEHLILFGGPEDNPLVAARSGALPVRFTPDALIAGDTAFALASHTVICAGVDPLDPARLIAVVAGDALGRWIPLCAGTAMNPFAAPERFPGVIVWRMHDDQEAFSEVWRTAPADPAPPPQ